MKRHTKEKVKQLNKIWRLESHIVHKTQFLAIKSQKTKSKRVSRDCALKLLALFQKIMSLQIQKRVIIETPVPKYPKGCSDISYIINECPKEMVYLKSGKILTNPTIRR